MKKIIAILLVAFLSPSFFCQKFEFEPPLLNEYYFLPDSSGGLFQFVYRFNYDKLTFVKEGERYVSKFRITIELQDSTTTDILRASEDKMVSVFHYDETINPNLSVQGLLNIQVQKKKYFLSISLTDLLSNIEIPMPKLSVDLLKPHSKSMVVSHGENGKYYLANRRETLPFSPELYSLIFEPELPKKTVDSLCLNFESPTDSFSVCSHDKYKGSFLLKEDSLGIYLSPQHENSTHGYFFSNISKTLPEGKYTINVTTEKKSFLEVKWWRKPFSLLNYEVSLKALGIIEQKSVVDSLKVGSNKFGYKKLFTYWRKYDPTPNSVYNDLMAEFYSRADYTQKTFSNFATPDGMMSDRGTLYIKYGQPSSIERTTGINGRNIEIWIYEKQNLTYYFRDITGTGNYVLINE